MKRVFVGTLLAIAPVPAFAHPGDHHAFADWQSAVQHLLGSPFHAALLLGATALACGLAVHAGLKSRKRG